MLDDDATRVSNVRTHLHLSLLTLLRDERDANPNGGWFYGKAGHAQRGGQPDR